MNRRQRIESLFDGALDRPSAERAEWLANACADDAEPRAEVEALLDQRGALLFDLGRYAESERTHLAGLARAARSLGREHPTTESLRETLANALAASGR